MLLIRWAERGSVGVHPIVGSLRAAGREQFPKGAGEDKVGNYRLEVNYYGLIHERKRI